MLNSCIITQLPKFTDRRGDLTFIQNGPQLPFKIERLYYLYDVPAAAERGGHAHRNLHQLIIALSGSFEVRLYDGIQSGTYTLNKPYEALYVCPMIWRELYNFSSGSVTLVLASSLYDETDYIRNIDEYNLIAGQIRK